MVGNLTIFSNRFMPLLASHKIPSIGLEPATAADFTSPASSRSAAEHQSQFAGLGTALAAAGPRRSSWPGNIPEAAAVASFVNAA